MLKKYTIQLFVSLVVLLPLSVYGIMNWYNNTYSRLPVYGGENHFVDSFSVHKQNGGLVTNSNWNNKIVVVNFFFTHCTSVCPKMMFELKKVQAAYPTPDVQLASFTVDPERDSVGRLNNYASQYGIAGNWDLLTGEKMQLYRLARKSFLLTVTDGDGGPNDFIHSEQLVLIDKNKKIRGYYKGTDDKEVAQLINDIKKLRYEAN